MPILNISQNDDLQTVVRKCNSNFNYAYKVANSLLRNSGEAIRNMVTEFTDDLLNTVIPGEVTTQIAAADIQGQVSDAISDALSSVTTTTLSDFMTESGCTVTACSAKRWGDVAFIRFSYRLNSSLTVPSNGDVTDVTLGTLKVGWRPLDMTNVILDQTRILVGDVGNNGVIQIRSANSRGTSYTIDENAVLYASMFLIIGLQ